MNAWEAIFSAWMPDPAGTRPTGPPWSPWSGRRQISSRRGDPPLSLDALSDAYARREAAALRFAFRSGFLLGVRLMAQDAP